jgi:hypothetical protein
MIQLWLGSVLASVVGKRRKEVPLSRVKRILATGFASAAMLAMIAAPAMAHIHVTIPADCAATTKAANNAQGVGNNPVQVAPFGALEGTPAPDTSPAPDDCPR